jgi:protein-tyrosine phosphatase
MSLIATFDINDDDGNDHDGGNDRKKQPSNKSPSQPPLRIRHSIYVGGKEDAKSLEKLQQRKITHILNVTPPKVANSQMGVPNYFERQQHFQYLRVPLWDDPTGVRELQEHHASMVTFIHRGLYHGNVLVHCAHGISRSTTIVALYLMERRHMTLAEALAMLQRRRPQAQPIPAFMEYLKRVDVTLDHDGSRLTSAKKRARNAMVEAKGHDTPPGKRRAIGPAMPPTFDDDPARPQSNNMSVGPSLPSPADESKERSKTLPPPETFSYDPEPIQPEWLELPPELQTIDFSTDGAAAASWDKHAPYTEHPLPLVPVGTPPTFSPASPALCFHLHSVDGRARAATLFFPNGGPPVPTPRFMPVGTKGTLKGVLPDEIAAMNCPIILANTYHLAIQPGTALIDERFGGLHKFMGGLAAVEEDASTKQTTRSQSTSQPRRLYNLLTDSGGFQMVSLASLSNVTEQGVVFQSPYTGKNIMSE